MNSIYNKVSIELSNKILTLSNEQKEIFKSAFKDKSKTKLTAYFLLFFLPLGHYIYLKKSSEEIFYRGLTIISSILLCILFRYYIYVENPLIWTIIFGFGHIINLIWSLIDLFKIPSYVRDYNNKVGNEIFNEITESIVISYEDKSDTNWNYILLIIILFGFGFYLFSNSINSNSNNSTNVVSTFSTNNIQQPVEKNFNTLWTYKRILNDIEFEYQDIQITEKITFTNDFLCFKKGVKKSKGGFYCYLNSNTNFSKPDIIGIADCSNKDYDVAIINAGPFNYLKVICEREYIE